jgi:hypothetical protein
MSTGWRNLSIALGAICLVQLWRDCSREVPSTPDCRKVAALAPSPSHARAPSTGEHGASPASEDPPAAVDSAANKPFQLYGFTVPSWALWFAPHPGEDLRAYRNRMLPLAQAAVAPQRARVARSRDNFAALAHLDAGQRAELDTAARETAAALQERVMAAVLNGEVMPASFKPMAGVSVARELLDIVGRGNRRFLDSLRDDQRTALADHPFDFADYLVFSTPWEDALKFLD